MLGKITEKVLVEVRKVGAHCCPSLLIISHSSHTGDKQTQSARRTQTVQDHCRGGTSGLIRKGVV